MAIQTITRHSDVARVSEWFAKDTEAHELTVLRDEGVYRHLRCGAPGTGMGSWHVTTWPGYLAISGDMGDWIFTREHDMLLDFFRGDQINPDYWLEKCVAWDRNARPRGVIGVDLVSEIAMADEDVAIWKKLDRAFEILRDPDLAPVAEPEKVSPRHWENWIDVVDPETDPSAYVLAFLDVYDGLDLDEQPLLRATEDGLVFDEDAVRLALAEERRRDRIDERLSAWGEIVEEAELQEERDATNPVPVFEKMSELADTTGDHDYWEHSFMATDPSAILACLMVKWARDAYLAEHGHENADHQVVLDWSRDSEHPSRMLRCRAEEHAPCKARFACSCEDWHGYRVESLRDEKGRTTEVHPVHVGYDAEADAEVVHRGEFVVNCAHEGIFDDSDKPIVSGRVVANALPVRNGEFTEYRVAPTTTKKG